MKVILTGSTGWIGGEVLKQCLEDSRIDSLVILSRRKIPKLDSNPKAKVIVLSNFLKYGDDVLQELDRSDACIWSQGTYDGDHTVEVDYPAAFFDTFTSTPSYASRQQPFRYVHVSGCFVEPDQGASLWFLSKARKGRGLGQTKVLGFGNEKRSKGLWKTYITRPGGVLPATTDCYFYHNILSFLITGHYSVRNDELAATMIDLAINGGSRPILESKEIGIEGRKMLAAKL